MNGLKKAMFVLFTVILCGAFALGSVQTASAAWPDKPITIFIPFAAGGSMDASVRALAPAMEKALGQSIVLINKTGGGGSVALGILAGTKPDGYTLSAGTSSGIFRIPVLRKVPYNPLPVSRTFLPTRQSRQQRSSRRTAHLKPGRNWLSTPDRTRVRSNIPQPVPVHPCMWPWRWQRNRKG